MRPWARYLVVFLGLSWLSGVVLAIGFGGASWRVAVWLVLGCVCVWFFGVKPEINRRAIARSAGSQSLQIDFDAAGARVVAKGTGEFRRTWTEFERVYVQRKGILLYMSDGVNHWLPLRIFASRKEMEALAQTIQSRIVALQEDDEHQRA